MIIINWINIKLIISSFNESVEKDHLVGKNKYPGDDALYIYLERLDAKKLVKG